MIIHPIWQMVRGVWHAFNPDRAGVLVFPLCGRTPSQFLDNAQPLPLMHDANMNHVSDPPLCDPCTIWARLHYSTFGYDPRCPNWGIISALAPRSQWDIKGILMCGCGHVFGRVSFGICPRCIPDGGGHVMVFDASLSEAIHALRR